MKTNLTVYYNRLRGAMAPVAALLFGLAAGVSVGRKTARRRS
jgi:hypothetical protein